MIEVDIPTLLTSLPIGVLAGVCFTHFFTSRRDKANRIFNARLKVYSEILEKIDDVQENVEDSIKLKTALNKGRLLAEKELMPIMERIFSHYTEIANRIKANRDFESVVTRLVHDQELLVVKMKGELEIEFDNNRLETLGSSSKDDMQKLKDMIYEEN